MFFSTCKVSKNVLLRWRQSVIISGREMALSMSTRKASISLGIVDEGLDDRDLVVLVEKRLRLRQRHIDEEIVEFRHADLEDRDDRIALDARRDAEGRLGAFGDQETDLVADAHAERVGEALTDGDAASLVEAARAPLAQIAGDAGQVREIVLAHAAREHARLTELRGDASRALDHRNGGLDAWTLAIFAATSSQSLKGVSSACTKAWPLTPRILSISS